MEQPTCHATAHVPHISNLDLVILRHKDDLLYPQVILRRRLSVRDATGPRLAPEWTTRSYCKAWAAYTQGNVVSDSQAQTIQNFTLVMAGTGKHENEEEYGVSRIKREELGSVGRKLDSTEIKTLLQEVQPKTTTDDAKTNVIGKRINSAMIMVRRLLQGDGTAAVEIDPTQRASAFHRALPAAAPKATAKAKAKGNVQGTVVRVEIYRKNYDAAYKQWCAKLHDSDKKPTPVQWNFMDAVHHRCETEAEEEQRGKVNTTKEEPARLFVHGLPGSGKTQVMLWLAEYFQQVWGWTKGMHFIYLAPLNSMAARIGGSTVHSWGEVPWVLVKQISVI